MSSLRLAACLIALSLAGCEGPVGPAGPPGDPGENGENGTNGTNGTNGDAGCNGLNAGETPGLAVALTPSKPANGKFFVAGEHASVTIQLHDRCGRALAPAEVGTANLYLVGPRSAARTAAKLLNCVVDRAAPDRQHHFIALGKPSYADPGQPNLEATADGALHYRFAAITDEAAGTYTATLWAKSKDERDQAIALADLQIGTDVVESDTTGAPEASSCANCHRTPDGVFTMHHVHTSGFAPLGNRALDSAPIAACKACHNLDGYSPNPIVRKVHGVHRGEHQLAPGAAHADYGLGDDPSLAEYVNVGFPAMPSGELDCATCHQDDAWKTRPSRLACGTCHDNVQFADGKLVPPRVYTKTCVADGDCASLGNYVTCAAGVCTRVQHPKQADDAQCAVCHSPDSNTGVSPIPLKHEVIQLTRTRGLAIIDGTLAGGSGPNGTFMVGDVITVGFKLVDAKGNVVGDLKTNSALSSTCIIGGPTDDRQRIFSQLNPKTQGTLTFDAQSGRYTWVLPSAIPAAALAPLNSTAPFTRPNLPGTYTVWLWVNETVTVGAASARDAANLVLDFPLGADAPVRPREVITAAACNRCHVRTQAHGGGRAVRTDQCSLCHSEGALDRGIGARGTACTTDAQCRGSARGWEQCQDTNADGKLDTCVAIADPTPGQVIDLSVMVHDIHFARLREGYAERKFIDPGKLEIIGFQNSVNDFSEVLLPMDVRNCRTCHADAGGACSADKPCGVGQECVAGSCRNRAWTAPSTRVCLSCHDSGAAFGHAALMTWQSADGPVETCDVCHGESGEFSVEKMHNVANPFVPPYPREPQP